MGYIKTTRGVWIGKKFGKYFVGHYDENTKCWHDCINEKNPFKKGTLVIFHKFPLSFPDFSKVREISFDLENKSITFDYYYWIKKYHKKEIKNITNNAFFEYVRKNIEKLFPSYDVNPNKQRTIFKFKKKTNGEN